MNGKSVRVGACLLVGDIVKIECYISVWCTYDI